MLPVTAALAVWLGGARRPTAKTALLTALPISIGATVLIGFVTLYLYPWYPVTQLGIGVGCLFLVLLVVRSPKVRRSTAVALILGTFFVVEHAWSVALDLERHCALDAARRIGPIAAESDVRVIRQALQESIDRGDGGQFSEGWVEEIFSSDQAHEFAMRLSRIKIPQPAWHSWLTGIGTFDTSRAYGAWYPGGPLASNLDGIVLKVRAWNMSSKGSHPR